MRAPRRKMARLNAWRVCATIKQKNGEREESRRSEDIRGKKGINFTLEGGGEVFSEQKRVT